MNPFHSETEIENVVEAFEACTFGKDEFKHRHHVIVAVWYVQRLGKEAALERMRTGLIRFLDHHGVDRKKYKESVTVFWIELIADKLNQLGAEMSLVEKCNRLVDLLS